MELQQLINAITPEVFHNLRRAVELGKWPNGVALTKEQKEHCMQAIIAYELKHLPPEQRTGYVPPKTDPCATDHKPETGDGEQPIKWQ